MPSTYQSVIKYATQRRAPFFEIAKKYLFHKAVILDIGAGNAAFAEFIGRKDIYMIDGNQDTVAQLRKHYPNYFYAQLPDLPFPEEYFDIIHCSHVIEHLKPEEFFSLLQHCDRCLRRGGILIFSTPLMWSQFWDDLSHIRPYSPRIFEKYLCGIGISNPTREIVSRDYTIVELQYRYRLSKIGEDLVVTRFQILEPLMITWFRLLSRIGLRRIEKTGYTIVLKKGKHR